MGALVEELPGGIGVALDLAGGAIAAYAGLVRGNRILSAAAAFLYGVCVAALVQAIAFVLLNLASQQSQAPTIVAFGSFCQDLVFDFRLPLVVLEIPGEGWPVPTQVA